MMRHEVKTWPPEWRAVACGEKTGDLRFNDRSYQIGDVLVLREWTSPCELTATSPPRSHDSGVYSGRVCERQITHILTGGQFGLADGYVMLSLAPVPAGYIIAGPEGTDD